MLKEKEQEYKCKYCGIKMYKFDYENYNGYCGKCKEILEWKKILENTKKFKK
jgi:transcription initiation factor TFIIIB Brf1 subunit/transcription initiation factor TFIIB